ncbi:hypothetical protein Pint_31859 [Pistacia integerrima]|uniref:Uncharacterized protein n=1 Tax=Pistacia integerrima TaxID=434235 RepID=A0ACC0XS90_9ROSI|nr:hypothetical protein Pint_31859 [Pistacia integerrima]
MLTHPSIGRFHLQIHSKPSSQNLSVIDLSFVHGTWVSERKIESCVPVELNEGDTIKIGGSTRIYRLHWIPLSHAYDMDKPFVSPLDVPVAEEKEEENQVETHQVEKSEPFQIGKSELSGSLVVEPKEEQTCQGLNSFSTENCEQHEKKKSLVVEENEEGICQDEISIFVHDKPSQSLDWFLEGIISLFCDEGSELLPETEIPFSGIVPIDLACPAGGGVGSEIITEQVHRENEPLLSVVMQPSEAEMQGKPSMDKNLNLLSALNSGCSNEEGFPEAELSKAGNHSPREGLEQKEIPSFCSSVLEESVNKSLPVGEIESLAHIAFGQEEVNQRVFYRFKQTNRSGGKTTRSHSKADVELQIQEDIENKSISKILFAGFEEEEEEIFTPNKENFSPDTLPLKSLKRKGKLEKIKPSRSYRKSSSKVTISPNIQPEEDLNFSSDKENQTPKVLQEQKLARHASRNQVNLEEERAIMKKRAERVPFQSLVANSSGH